MWFFYVTKDKADQPMMMKIEGQASTNSLPPVSKLTVGEHTLLQLSWRRIQSNARPHMNRTLLFLSIKNGKLEIYTESSTAFIYSTSDRHHQTRHYHDQQKLNAVHVVFLHSGSIKNGKNGRKKSFHM